MVKRVHSGALTALMLLTHAPAQAATQPEHFFVGRLESSGTLKVIFRASETVTDHGTGRTEADGVTVLDQIVERPGEAPRRRVWRLQQVSPGKVSGTLSGADGPVVGDYVGGVLRLRYTMADGVHVDQRLTFAADGRSASNQMTFRKFGFNVATLKGTIRKLDDK